MLLTPNILTIYILDALFFLFASIAFYKSILILKNYDASASTPTQYKLEKSTYLASTIIKYIFIIKIPLLIFFVFTLDKISHILTGAMCGAGVVNATVYGNYLLIIKIINLYLFAYWIVLNREDLEDEQQPYVKLKFSLFIFAYGMLMIEMLLEILMFSSIDLKSVVDCCGVIYSSSENSYMSMLLNMKTVYMLSAFYGVYFMIVLFYIVRNNILFMLSNLLFLFISLLSLISFFGTYIYELPTHHCPFCFLQREYYYVGYILYILLFIGTFYGAIVGLMKFQSEKVERYCKISLIFSSLYVIVVSYYPLSYYIKNGVWL